MSLENLALAGVKQNGYPDVAVIKKYHPEVIASFFLLCKKIGVPWHDLFSDDVPKRIISGYRDHSVDSAVKNSPHAFGIALDIWVSWLSAHDPFNRQAILNTQIKWITEAIEGKFFTRGGFYPQQNSIHLDQATDEWMKKFNGTKFWVKWDGDYAAFNVLTEAIDYAKGKIIRG